jgi:L-alanine-DL-glutamate epimerase-like enolase superfamily enzyme
MSNLKIQGYRITRFQYKRDRGIGDSQVCFDTVHAFALELIDETGLVGLGFGHALVDPYPPEAALNSIFNKSVWPLLEGQIPAVITNRITRLRGGMQRDMFYGFEEALQIALWDLASQQVGLPLADYLGGRKRSVPVYASGLDFHMTDAEFTSFFSKAADAGFNTFKIKIGHVDPEWDLHRMNLLKQTVGADAGIMIDANEAWSAKEAVVRLTRMRDLGFDLVWIEDPILRDDFEGLKALRQSVYWTQVNSGEYLDLTGRRKLLQAGGTDILNVHGRVTDVMRIGWLAADMGIPVALGNTFLETGVHTACALPETNWMEYSFLNYEHLIDTPVMIKDGVAHVSDRPGLGFALSEAARTEWSAPQVLPNESLKLGPTVKMLTTASL